MSDGQRSSGSRSIGVHSMLNPSSEDQTGQHGRRRSAAQMEASSTETTPYLLPRPLSRMPSEESAMSDISPVKFESRANGDGRKILTPRSPTVRRGPLGQPTGSIDAHQTPFITAGSGRSFPEPVPSQPLLASISGYRQSHFPLPKAPTPPLAHSRRPSLGIIPSSAAASPGASTNYSSYSQGQTSPATPYGAHSNNPTPPGSFQLGPTPAGPLSAIPHQGLDQSSSAHPSRSYPGTPTYRHNSIPVAAASQSIQVFTISTAKGPVQVPVDVQAASRVADEKRRRNAGASARFRARRKEKEREASTTISRLEQRLRDALEDAEFYRSERDFLVEAVCRVPGGAREFFPRPESPCRNRREVSATPTGEDRTDDGSTSPPPYEVSARERERERRRDADAARKGEERNTRRRTEGYDAPQGTIEIYPSDDKQPLYSASHPLQHPSPHSHPVSHEPSQHPSFAPQLPAYQDRYPNHLSQSVPRYGAPPPAFARHAQAHDTSASQPRQPNPNSGGRTDRSADGGYPSYGKEAR
ncbi:hypothetical protein P152DRAFT_469505 [Eremomyces bilateralis CBS 781.70]|uniref:BZIP domain-containing protein n=1 Tax=Eremomyces bilateralis CBS 781.70 TaxID=1392243 RepID=A0A6G1GG09_9PEZI|nr:uncharacterized protein P152DRAFT_469505 [Eremomyces bilateralis CBS 781.70]KAF1817008.1 hypothetical protein P152DRAFT_469505 [Eremomyces bilateralis CBS 781.70]